MAAKPQPGRLVYLFGIVLAHTLAARQMTGHVARLAAAATAAGSLALGLYWITAL